MYLALTVASVENQEAVGVDPGTTAAHAEAAVGSGLHRAVGDKL